VTSTAPEPFLLLEPEAAPRLEAVPAIVPPAEPVLRLRSPALAGAAIIGFGLPMLWVVWLVTALFDRWATLGWIGLVVLLAGLGLIGIGIGRELSGLAALRRVDHLRAEFASGEAQRVEKAAHRWLQALPQHAAILPALAASETPEAMFALLRAGPAQSLREATDVLGWTAALQSVAIIAAMPSPALDALALGWCGVRLIRQVATLHGMRPGLMGTLALLRRTALSAATVAATEVAVNAATHAMMNHPLLRHLAGDVAGAGVAARRMIVLARAAAMACSPLNLRPAS
jgi:putative membrane protein